MPISFCLIGEDSLLIQCGNILLAQNHSIEIVVSPLKRIQDWAKKNNILCVASIEKISEINLKAIDYIFSIVNSRILSENIIQLARHGAINYHDSPLPKYAGLNATSWAILNNEKTHAITWHSITSKIDEGEILKQKFFPIEKHDTALTLNLRCYEAAIESFRELISDIEKKQLSPQKQNLQERSYYGLTHILPNFGFIDWQYFSAEMIDRICRSITFGRYTNNIGTLKLYFKNNYVIISQMKIIPTNEKNKRSPGTVTRIEKNSFTVTTSTQNIKIEKLISQTGNMLSMEEFIEKYGISVGYQFMPLQEEDRTILQEWYPIALKNEKYWVDQLQEVREHAVFSVKQIDLHKKTNSDCLTINLKKIFRDKSPHTIQNILLTSILTYLSRLNDHEKVSIFVVHPQHEKLNNECYPLISACLPLSFDIPPHFSLGQTLNFVSDKLSNLYKHKSYLTDLLTRHHTFEDQSIEPNIIVNFVKGDTDFLPHFSKNVVLYFQINEEAGTIQIFHRFETSSQNALSGIILNISQHLVNILINLVNNPHFCVSTFCFLTEHERHKLLHNWGAGEKRFLPHLSISSLFEKQVELRPQHTAVMMGNKSVSYLHLWELSEKVAHAIRKANLPPQVPIGVYLTRSIEMFAVILGILKTNAIYVPLDTKYPPLKTLHIIKDANVSYIFTQEKFISDLETYFKDHTQNIKLLCTENILATDEKSSLQTSHKPSDSLDALAYIIFTSGTTGTPKGVMVTQKNVLNYCYWFLGTTEFNEKSIMDFSSSIAFDISVPCTLAPLLIGGRVAICDDEQKINPKQYLLYLIKHKVTHLEMTPGYLQLLLSYSNEMQQLTDLKFILLGADVVPSVDVARWLSICPHHQLINEYGPTETTVAVTSYFVDANKKLPESSVPIGRPGYNTQCYILDKYKNLCPAGIIGELYIGGEQVTRGYLNKPEITKEKFIFSNVKNRNEVLYKTGDTACWLPEGDLQFFGRNDQQVKVQGYRIEPMEIESVLLKIPGINQALVTLREGIFKEKYLRAYLVCDKKFLSNVEIKQFLLSHLPKYMVPKEFCIIDAVPLKENEKINYTALENKKLYLLPSGNKSSLKNDTDFESTIKDIWDAVFNTTSITLHDDFFEIGGDSLMALQIISEIQHYYAMEVTLQCLFECPTITLLAEKIRALYHTKHKNKSLLSNNKSTSTILLSKGSHETPLFLVHPIGGTIFWYKPLASLLQGKYTVYGIQDPNVEGNTIQFSSLKKMAEYYLMEIEKVYSGENYCIGGASFGATVAFEMAHQLISSGKKIEFLGLFDGWATYPDEVMQKSTFDLSNNTSMYDQKISDDKKNFFIKQEEHRKSLLMKYQLSPLNTTVTLFKAIELWSQFQEVDNAYNGWHDLVHGKIITYKVPGNHETMFFNPNVYHLSDMLKKELAFRREAELLLEEAS